MDKLVLLVLMVLFLSACPASSPGDSGSTEDQNDETASSSKLSGKIALSQTSGSTRSLTDENTQVIAQNTSTGEIVSVITDSDGAFTLDIPDSDSDSYIVSLINSEGKALGSLVMGDGDAGEVCTGINPDGEVNLGTITLPAADGEAIEIGSGASVSSDLLDTEITARVDSDGNPVGITSSGKGSEAQGSTDITNVADRDQDGLIDIIDADDDGDGIIDEMDSDSDFIGTEEPELTTSLFFLLQIQGEEIKEFIDGDDNNLAEAYAQTMRVDIKVIPRDDLSYSPQDLTINMVETPGPLYLNSIKSGTGSDPFPWSQPELATGSAANLGILTPYQLGIQMEGSTPETQRVQYWGAGMWLDGTATSEGYFETGDVFTLKIVDSNDEVSYVNKMINYVFREPIRFLAYADENGETASPTYTEYDPFTSGQENNLAISTTDRDLYLKIKPAKDDDGSYMTDGGEFTLTLGYIATGDENINFNQINRDTTYGSGMPSTEGWDSWVRTRSTDISTMNLDGDGNLIFHIPASHLPETITLDDGTEKTVERITLGINYEINPGTDNVSRIENSLNFAY